jgi:hypothetical protein
MADVKMIDDLRALLAVATPGPYVVIESEPGIDDATEFAVANGAGDVVALGCYERDARALAALLNAAPALIEALRDLAAAREDLQATKARAEEAESEVARLTRERDEARAESARLSTARDHLEKEWLDAERMILAAHRDRTRERDEARADVAGLRRLIEAVVTAPTPESAEEIAAARDEARAQAIEDAVAVCVAAIEHDPSCHRTVSYVMDRIRALSKGKARARTARPHEQDCEDPDCEGCA